LNQLKYHLETIEQDSTIKGTVLTGFGGKAFVSGADINMLARLKTAEDGFGNSQTFHKELRSRNHCRNSVLIINCFLSMENTHALVL